MKFTESHEWVNIENDVATVGISDYAQKEMGDIVFVQLPAVGGDFAEIESVKAVSPVYSPVAGEVMEINEAILDNPAAVNDDAYQAWFVKVKFTDTAELLTEEEYKAKL